MAIEMTCRTCGKAYVPSRAEILQGPDCYRVCPDCRRAIQTGDVAEIFKGKPMPDAGSVRSASGKG